MNAAFDTYAASYDTDFTYSQVGKKQRERVWSLLAEGHIGEHPWNVLEVNCGTGEDAVHFAQLGHRITASDISAEMVACAASKSRTRGIQNATFLQAGFHQLGDLGGNAPFDLIFSNFGGLNCASPDEFSNFLQAACSLLKPGGSLIAVIMPRVCLWESFYYLLKRPAIAFRRLKDSTVAKIDETELNVFYYSPRQVARNAEQFFHSLKVAPIGFFLPPSYLEHFFKNKPALLERLAKWESKLPPSSFLASVSDHYYIHLVKK